MPTLSPVQLVTEVVTIKNVAPQHFLFSLHAPLIARGAQAGQFVHVLPREINSSDPLLRRAFSIMAVREEQIDILFRVGGNGTSRLSQARVGDFLDVLGPLGQPFDTTLFHVKQAENVVDEPLPRPILIGGGVGVPPMVFLAKTFKSAGFEPLIIIGARSAAEVLGRDEFEALSVEAQIATDDGSIGHAGRVTDLLEIALQKNLQAGALPLHSRFVVYACGPLPMLRAVAAMASRFGALCQVSLEENMPCGIGVCNGCVVAMKSGVSKVDSTNAALHDASGCGRYRRICIAGPAVWAHEIDWEAV